MNYENFDTMRGMPRWGWVVEVHDSASQTYVKGGQSTSPQKPIL